MHGSRFIDTMAVSISISFCKRCTEAGKSPNDTPFHRSARTKLCQYFTPRVRRKALYEDPSTLDNRDNFTTLPDELLHMICARVSCVDTLLNLSVTSRALAGVISNSNSYFWILWKAMNSHQSRLLALADYHGAKRSLALIGQRGCEICGKPRIRKVYPFGIRCCEPCLNANIVRLKSSWLSLTFYEPRTTNRYGRSAPRFYWRSQVERHGALVATFRHPYVVIVDCAAP